MSILITGGSGFIGSFITEHLLSLGKKVVVPTRSLKSCWRLHQHKDLTIVEGDLSEISFQNVLFKRYQPQVVIHTAWDGMTRDKRNDPSQVKNLILSEQLLQMTARHKSGSFIGFGSQAEYGVHNQDINENALPKPDSLYGEYKLKAGIGGQRFANKHGFNYAWLRLFSSFGPRDWEDYIIPYSIRMFLKNQSPQLSTCEQLWDYLYVKDIARLTGRVVEKKEKFCDIYNLSSGQALRLREIIELLKDMTQSKAKPQYGAIPHHPNGLMLLKGNHQKFENTFGAMDLTPITQALQETVEWYKRHLTGESLGRS